MSVNPLSRRDELLAHEDTRDALVALIVARTSAAQLLRPRAHN
jgi:hypothetical protein